MKRRQNHRVGDDRLGLDERLAAYLVAAGAVGTVMASESKAVVVNNTTVQPFGINGAVNIDFNSDGQTDFQIDHDRVDLSGGNVVDYLQIDKNDVNGAANPLDFDPISSNQAATFPPGATTANNANEAAYVINPNLQGSYPAALKLGTPIGPASAFDYQERENFQGSGKWIRANRLIDEDRTQIDQVFGGQPASSVQIPFNGPNFVGLGGQVRYLGLKMELNSSGLFNYGWAGIRITNEADATGDVVGWGYEPSGARILAGSTVTEVAGDYNLNGIVDAADYTVWRDNLGLMGGATSAQGDGTGEGNVTIADYSFWTARFGNTSGTSSSLYAVPEPSSILLGVMIGVLLCSRYVWNRIIGR